jgi:UDP-glucose 4-epimerase
MKHAVLVIGGCGFIGSALVARLLSCGAQRVVVVDDLSYGRPESLPADTRIELIVRDAGELDLRSVGPVATIYYLAAAPYVPDSIKDPERTWHVNVTVPNMFLERNRLSRWPPVIYASTGEVYGNVASGRAVETMGKTSADGDHTPYAASRIIAERDLSRHAGSLGLNIMAMRLFNVIGPGATHGYFVPDMIRQLLKCDVVRHGDLSTVRDMVWIEDTVDALIRASRSVRSGFTAINVSCGRGHRMAEILKQLIDLSCKQNVKLRRDVSRDRSADIRRLVGDNTKAQRLLGWHPMRSVRYALNEALRSYQHTPRWPYEHTFPDSVHTAKALHAMASH